MVFCFRRAHHAHAQLPSSHSLIGFGLTFACTAAPLLITELAFPTYRGPLTSLYNSSWYLGSIVAAWATYGTFRIDNTWSWRVPSLLQGLPSILQVCLIWFIPESPRWCIDNGREEQAMAFFVKYHCSDDHEDPLAQFEFDECKAAIQVEREAKGGSTWLSLFRGKGNQKRMRVILAIAFFSQWSGNGLVSYYLNDVSRLWFPAGSSEGFPLIPSRSRSSGLEECRCRQGRD